MKRVNNVAYSREYILRLKSNAPAIKGSVVTFTADLLEMNGTLATVGDTTLKWEWLIDDHKKQEFRSTVPHVEWTYHFPRHSNKNLNKTYKLEVTVSYWYLFFNYIMATAKLEVNVTSMLNGDLKLVQDGNQIKSMNISTETLLDQRLDIRHEDMHSLENATNIVVHWFVDCHYVRQTNEFKTQQIFTEPNRTHRIEALVEATFKPIPSITVPKLTSKLISNWRSQHKADLPYVCGNKSQTVPDGENIYGHFETNITVFDAISNLIVNGSAWIDDGDDYNLNIFCSGSPNFEYCIQQIDGPYILEGNETCDEWITIDECQQKHKLPQSVVNVKSFTVLVIIRNAVSIQRKIFVVNIKQPVLIVAAVVGAIVFTLCIIAAVVCCLVRCIHKKRSMKRKSIRSEAETTLIGQNSIKISETKRIPNKNHL
ncbi:uncharacterized protein LOC116348301 isoform X2 [Contarinia nasturtii]|uniref:uncharacterized protein LOC116348301 isoform X2 n=1 Tax=Contarinia nasturtii TaxID=265458 RepID=UPI0012D3F246|nr:uncharacterized protein LOC116348301 isoform X2 [Contarinia nasturtii]